MSDNYDATILQKLIDARGIPNTGCNSRGKVFLEDTATQEHLDMIEDILNNYGALTQILVEVVPAQEIFPVQVQFDNVNSRIASLEAQLHSIKDLLIKLNS